MPKLLTIRKAAWVNARKPHIIRGTPLKPSGAVAGRYNFELSELIQEMTEETYFAVRELFAEEHMQQYFAQDATTSSQARILTNWLLRKFNSRFAKKALPIAQRFADQSNKHSSAAVHTSIQKLSGGLSLPTASITPDMREILKATITENVSLITGISQKYLAGVQQAVMRSITTGNGMQDLVPYLQKKKEYTLRQAQLVSMDQTRKAFQNLGKARMENLGIKKYEWNHSGGSDEPRPLHVRMSGKIYSLDDPPVIDEHTGERGIPGQAINCRCFMTPVISFD